MFSGGVNGTGPGAGVVGFASSSTGVGVVGNGTGNAVGVYGLSASGGIGVRGESVTNVGVYADSDTNNGVLAVTGSGSAAAVSALSPSTAGLAYYGHGGIQLTGSFAQKASGSSWSNPSDARIKKDVKNLPWGLEELMSIRPVTFQFNGKGGTVDDGRVHVGIIAQELERVFPSMVSFHKVKLNKDDAKDTDIRIVDPSAFTYVLISAVKEQQELIERQGARIAALERGRAPIAASLLNGGVGAALAMGLLPLAFVALRRRRNVKT
jgi:hypothetical protein